VIAALTAVLGPAAMEAFADARAWWADHLAATASFDVPIDRAIAGATRVDRLGYAFAGGYAAALHALVPDLDRRVLASLAATEEGGAHPRAIATVLEGGTVTGKKKWVTLGPDGGSLLVVAKLGTKGDRPELRVAKIASDAPGVTLTPLGHMPFVPEIPHAELALDRAPVDVVLEGDGYDRYLKPFRTIEDLHVHAALLAWLASVAARHAWPEALRARMLASLVTARSLAQLDATAPEVHVALGGLIADTTSLVEACDAHWPATDADLRARWERDRPLLAVAGKARAQRLAKAWEFFGVTPHPSKPPRSRTS
jgi:hypothetical protein